LFLALLSCRFIIMNMGELGDLASISTLAAPPLQRLMHVPLLLQTAVAPRFSSSETRASWATWPASNHHPQSPSTDSLCIQLAFVPAVATRRFIFMNKSELGEPASP
jgi:hypothetical protein